MHRKSPQWLDDIREGCDLITEWTEGLTLAEYDGDRFLRSAVERSFEIMGEALRRLERTDPETVARIPEYRTAIDFRNVLAHGYDSIDNTRVWDFIETRISPLREHVAALLVEAEADEQERAPQDSS